MKYYKSFDLLGILRRQVKKLKSFMVPMAWQGVFNLEYPAFSAFPHEFDFVFLCP